MVIRQGELYWVDLPTPRGSEPGFGRPGVIVQSDRFNRSALHTTVICPITSNLNRAVAPGNVLLAKGEGNLPRRSVVVVSGIIAVDRNQLGKKIGMLSKQRINEILDGVNVLLSPAQ